MKPLVIWMALLLAGCDKKPECAEDVPCPFGSACIAGVCEARRCATSEQCGMEQYCGSSGSCTAGCQNDNDCYPGSSCDTTAATCVQALCTDAAQDCGYKQFCNGATGECYDAAGYYCRPCIDDSDCGDADNHCLSGFCGVWCQDHSDCPSGFDCIPVVDYNGNPQYFQCYTYCEMYEDYDPDGMGKMRSRSSRRALLLRDPASMTHP